MAGSGLLVLLLFLLILFKNPILRGIGSFLVVNDPLSQADVICVLAGDPGERCAWAAKLYAREMAPTLILTGGITNGSLEILGLDLNDADIGRIALLQAGVDSVAIDILPEGSSTWEEADFLLNYCLQKNWKRVIVVSSSFHTRRVHGVFVNKFKQAGIEALISGAPPLPGDYKLETWWKSEKGLLFVNNEYLKLMYYAWKY